jgi:hypothetical protein
MYAAVPGHGTVISSFLSYPEDKTHCVRGTSSINVHYRNQEYLYFRNWNNKFLS